jgi:paraquat-inducible protein A
VSLALNVTALFVPFLDMRRGLSTSEYSLPRSVSLMWDSGLYVLAAIIVVFSVCFPFFKLGVLTSIVVGWIHPRKRTGWLTLVENLGKWSMLDVFIVCLMIALANDQWLVDAQPRIGILCFTFAIVLSMTASAVMDARLSKPGRLVPIPRKALNRLALVQVCLLGLVITVLLVPFLEIDDWLLVDRPISLAGAIVGLWETEAHTLAAIVAVFLALAPLASNALCFAILRGRARDRDVSRVRRALIVVRHWDMLDVFALALGIFLVEGREFVRTDLAWGAFFLALLLAFYWPVSAVYQRRIARS